MANMAKWPLTQPLELDPNFPREGVMSWEEQAYAEGADDSQSLKARPVEVGETGICRHPRGSCLQPRPHVSMSSPLGSSPYLPTLNSFFLGTVSGPCVDLRKCTHHRVLWFI